MSTKTEKFDLHQWAPTDNFSRAEINENFQKLDLSALKLAFGSFTGTGVAGEQVTLGFKPKLLILLGPQPSGSYTYNALSLITETVSLRNIDGRNNLDSPAEYVAFTDDGFTTTWAALKNVPQHYIVFY